MSNYDLYLASGCIVQMYYYISEKIIKLTSFLLNDPSQTALAQANVSTIQRQQLSTHQSSFCSGFKNNQLNLEFKYGYFIKKVSAQ